MIQYSLGSVYFKNSSLLFLEKSTILSRFKHFELIEEGETIENTRFCLLFGVLKMLYGNPSLKFFLFFYLALLADSIFYPDQAHKCYLVQCTALTPYRSTYSTYPGHLQHSYFSASQ